jgi:hypothetical protein
MHGLFRVDMNGYKMQIIPHKNDIGGTRSLMDAELLNNTSFRTHIDIHVQQIKVILFSKHYIAKSAPSTQ